MENFLAHGWKRASCAVILCFGSTWHIFENKSLQLSEMWLPMGIIRRVEMPLAAISRSEICPHGEVFITMAYRQIPNDQMSTASVYP